MNHVDIPMPLLCGKDPVKLQITVDPVQCWHTCNLLLLFLHGKLMSSFSEADENAFSSVPIQGS